MLELIRQDECLEVTPLSVRPRKVELTAQARARQRGRTRE
jgi:predicted membrane GTPase involved in stress response